MVAMTSLTAKSQLYNIIECCMKAHKTVLLAKFQIIWPRFDHNYKQTVCRDFKLSAVAFRLASSFGGLLVV